MDAKRFWGKPSYREFAIVYYPGNTWLNEGWLCYELGEVTQKWLNEFGWLSGARTVVLDDKLNG